MMLTGYVFRNLHVDWRRSLGVSGLTFFAVFFMVVFSSFIGSIKINVETAVINLLAGEIRFSCVDADEDIFSISGSWEEAGYLKEKNLAQVKKMPKEVDTAIEVLKRVRHNVPFIADEGENGAMVLSLEPRAAAYQSSLKLEAGRYLEKDYEVILTSEQAKNLDVEVGEIIGALAQDRDGYTRNIALTVVRIGSADLLELFGFDVAYMDLKSTKKLMGFAENEVTDVKDSSTEYSAKSHALYFNWLDYLPFFLLLVASSALNGIEKQVLRGYLNLQSGEVAVVWKNLKEINSLDPGKFLYDISFQVSTPEDEEKNSLALTKLSYYLKTKTEEIRAFYPTVRRYGQLFSGLKAESLKFYGLTRENADFLLRSGTLRIEEGQLPKEGYQVCLSAERAEAHNLMVGDWILLEAVTPYGAKNVLDFQEGYLRQLLIFSFFFFWESSPLVFGLRSE